MFKHIFKAGTSEGAEKAWESRRDNLKQVFDENMKPYPHADQTPPKESSGGDWVEAPDPRAHQQSQSKKPHAQMSQSQFRGRVGRWEQPQANSRTMLNKFDTIFKEGVDYSERARRAWETRARGGETARAARAFVQGKPLNSHQEKMKAMQAELDKLKGQLKAMQAANALVGAAANAMGKPVAEAPAPKGKLPSLDTKQRESLFNYFAGGGPKDKGERAYYMARAKQIVDGVARPAGMSGKYGVDRFRVGKVEGMLYFIQKGWRKKHGV